MRTIFAEAISACVAELFVKANLNIPPDVKKAIDKAEEMETNPLCKRILHSCSENIDCAARKKLPACQDTGIAVVFADIGQEVYIKGSLENAVNLGVSKGFKKGFLRASVVSDPLRRENTKDNTPAVLHVRIVEGDCIALTVAPKGFGSENMSKLFMLNPTATVEDIVCKVTESVKSAGGNPCPPLLLGIGIGGVSETCMLAARRAQLRTIGRQNADPFYNELEQRILEAVNATGVGAQGLGGSVTALAVHVEPLATHIAGLPLAVNMCCHVVRHASKVI